MEAKTFNIIFILSHCYYIITTHLQKLMSKYVMVNDAMQSYFEFDGVVSH